MRARTSPSCTPTAASLMQGRRSRARHRRVRRRGPHQPGHLAPISTAATPHLARRDYRAGDRKLQPGDPAGAAQHASICSAAPMPTTARATSGARIADYDQAIKLDPNLAAAYFNRGLVHRRSGSADRAIADYDQAIKLNPNNVAAYNNRGIAYADSGKRSEPSLITTGAEARPELCAGLSQPRPDLARQASSTTAPSRISTARCAPRPTTRPPTTTAASRSKPRASSIARSPISTRRSRSTPTMRRYYDNRGNIWRNKGHFDRAMADYDKAIAHRAGLRAGLLQPLAGELSRRPLCGGGGGCRQGDGAQRALGPGHQPARAGPGKARRPRGRAGRLPPRARARPEPAAARRRAAPPWRDALTSLRNFGPKKAPKRVE